MGKLIPVILILLGIGAGTGAGFFLRPAPPEPEEVESVATTSASVPEVSGLALFEFPNQFMVPLVVDGRVGATMVLKLALEFDESQSDLVQVNAPRLRDALLQAMFDHANSGGFSATFTDNRTLTQLRRTLLEAAQKILGPEVARGVLITDLLRVGV